MSRYPANPEPPGGKSQIGGMADNLPILYNGSKAGPRNERAPPEPAMIRHPGQTGDGIMRALWRAFLAGGVLIGSQLATGTPSAWAQSFGSRSSLGGYGASPNNSMGGMDSGPIIPYAGNFGGFMPFRIGGGSTLSFQSRGASAMESTRNPFSLSPMTGGTTSMSGGMGQDFDARTRAFSPFRSQSGMGLGSGSRQVMPGAGTSVMPPNFGYPFYQPPSLLAPSSSRGMSM
jgi:hypothetical protein